MKHLVLNENWEFYLKKKNPLIVNGALSIADEEIDT